MPNVVHSPLYRNSHDKLGHSDDRRTNFPIESSGIRLTKRNMILIAEETEVKEEIDNKNQRTQKTRKKMERNPKETVQNLYKMVIMVLMDRVLNLNMYMYLNVSFIIYLLRFCLQYLAAVTHSKVEVHVVST